MVYLIVIVILILLYVILKRKSNHPTTIYYYYSPHCRYCVKMSPKYRMAKAMTLLTNPSVTFKELDTNKPENQNNYIDGVPTILKVISGQIYKYDGPVCHRSIARWIAA